MTPSFRLLLMLSDPDCDFPTRERAMKRLDNSGEAQALLARMEQVRFCTDPITQDQELDPNLVAEYLDYQLSQEDQALFEENCLKSDATLAELIRCYTIITNSLKNPIQGSADCRQRLYDLLHNPISTKTENDSLVLPKAPKTKSVLVENAENDGKGEMIMPKNHVLKHTLTQGEERQKRPKSRPFEQKPSRVVDALNHWKSKRQRNLQTITILAVMVALLLLGSRYKDQLMSRFNHFQDRPTEATNEAIETMETIAERDTNTNSSLAEFSSLSSFPTFHDPTTLDLSSFENQSFPEILPLGMSGNQVVPASQPNVATNPAIKRISYEESKE